MKYHDSVFKCKHCDMATVELFVRLVETSSLCISERFYLKCFTCENEDEVAITYVYC